MKVLLNWTHLRKNECSCLISFQGIKEMILLHSEFFFITEDLFVFILEPVFVNFILLNQLIMIFKHANNLDGILFK